VGEKGKEKQQQLIRENIYILNVRKKRRKEKTFLLRFKEKHKKALSSYGGTIGKGKGGNRFSVLAGRGRKGVRSLRCGASDGITMVKKRKEGNAWHVSEGEKGKSLPVWDSFCSAAERRGKKSGFEENRGREKKK